ncbi:MAG: hypothetical protein ACR2PX_10225 [Endozoicomonas sp.]|uniref:hypothetical protein n=1 Tax=Endozoicomonas sp. TaxID=1892382 RepID=UPI003D9B4A86
MFDLSTAPSVSRRLKPYFVDFIEMLALVQDEDGISKDDVTERILDEGEDEEEQDQLFINDCYELLECRAEIYGESYPFSIERNQTIKVKDNISNINRYYIFLLLCSYSSKVDDNASLRRDFEQVCATALQGYLPPLAECHVFGKSGLEIERYSGHISQKLEKLARDLGVNIDFEEDDFSPYNTGDNGLDVVAWLHIPGDSYKKYSQIYFAQCATGKEWPNKQGEPLKIGNLLRLNNNFSTIICIPYDTRKISGKPIDHNDITASVYLDRYRIITLLERGHQIDGLQCNQTHIQRALDYEEPFYE